MDTSTSIARKNYPLGQSRHSRRGQALVIVLSFMMLMTVLVLVFFGSVMTDAATSRASTGGVAARQLAQSAVQIVEGIITQATVPGTDTSIAWACQPGMIRTYGDGNNVASSTPLKYYKLYSAPYMVVDSPNTGGFTPDGDISPTWSTDTALNTDLNAPIYDATGNLDYPIVDPRAQSTPGYTETYPVQGFSYSNSITCGSVPGVVNTVGSELLPMPVHWLYVLRDGTLTAPTGGTGGKATFDASVVTATNPIVGRVAFWTDDESAKVNLNTASEGTYWDTPMSFSGGAGGGPNNTDTFSYNSSSAQSGQITALGDIIFANYIPAAHEYQRYPGHPATTCLSEIFGASLASFGSDSPTTGTVRAQLVQAIDASTPRTSDAGSGGAGTSTLGGTHSANAILQPNYNRLFASVDDFNFTPTRAAQSLGSATRQIIQQSHFFLTTSSKAPDLNPFGLPKITIWPIWDDSYASKRSTLDNAILHCSTVANGAATGTNSAQHRMIFQRENAASSTVDYSNIPRNQQLYQYLQTLTSRPIPGYGGAFTTKYSTAERDQILTEIFDYIRCTNLADQSLGSASYTPTLTSASTPFNVNNVRNGPAGSALGTQGAEGEVVPIQITQGTTTQGMGRIATISELTLVLDKADDRNDPSKPESGNLAHYITVNDSDNAGGVQYCVSGSPTTLPTLTGPPNQMPNTYSPDGSGGAPSPQTCVEWALFPKLSCPMAGYPGLANNIRIRYKSFQLSINGCPINHVQSGTLLNGSFSSGSTGSSVFDQYDIGRLGTDGTESTIGGVIGPQMLIEPSNGTYANTQGAPTDSFIPTGIVVVPGQSTGASATTTMTVAGSFTVQIFSPAGTRQIPGSLIQTLNFAFPTLTVPIPQFSSAASWTGTFRSSTGYNHTKDPPAPSNPNTGQFNYPKACNSGVAATNANRTQNTNPSFISGVPGSPVGPDVSRSVVPTGSSVSGDFRVIALSGTVPSTDFAVDMLPGATVGSTPTPLLTAGAPASTTFNCNGQRTGVQGPQAGMVQTSLCLPELSNNYGDGKRAPDIGIYNIGSNIPLMTGPNDGSVPADWDNGPGLVPDGAYFNKVDEGSTATVPPGGGLTPYLPYMYDLAQLQAEGLEPTQFYSPNQQLSSPVMLGSLLAGIDHPWRTLLFRPATLPGYQETSSGSSYTHPGGANPPDHLLLDFFRMPVVEPYAISEPLATAGKINLNTQIVPFTYITRTTGLRAVLKSVMMTAFNPLNPSKDPTSNATFIFNQKAGYVYGGYAGSPTTTGAFTTRYPIDLTNTINLLTTLSDNASTNNFPEFNRTTYTEQNPNFFIYPSQICDLPLIPLASAVTGVNAIAGLSNPITSVAGLGAFWNANSLTGDNSLERPYSLIYPRVTTQSNTFTVHVRAQSLQKVPSSVEPITTWNDSIDKMTGEYRGSFTIEKSFDPSYAAIDDGTGNVLSDTSDSSLPVAAAIRGDNYNPTGANATSAKLQHGALWRLVESKRFGE